jgi:hypothetical protein
MINSPATPETLKYPTSDIANGLTNAPSTSDELRHLSELQSPDTLCAA